MDLIKLNGTNYWEAVLHGMEGLIVDEIEDDGSGMWSHPSTATLDYD